MDPLSGDLFDGSNESGERRMERDFFFLFGAFVEEQPESTEPSNVFQMRGYVLTAS